MKKYFNFFNLIEVVVYFLILIILIILDVNEKIGINFTLIYLGVVFLFNFFYYTFNLIKNKKTPTISIYSISALFAYILSLGGMSFIKIKNNSYIEFIKNANDSLNMTKKQRIKSYFHYMSIWIVLCLVLIFIRLDDIGAQEINGIILLFIFLILIYRIFLLYDFTNKIGGKNNE